MPTYAELISIGDEILYGQTLDTNSHWMSARLDEIGIKVRRKITIGDDREEILSALRESESRADVVLITGGLGPTKDDLTKPLLAEYFGVPLLLNEEALQEVTALFARMGRELTATNRGQAELPANCQKITNELGTAPGMWFEERNTIFVSMPGVPFEMRGIMEKSVLPRLQSKFSQGVIYHKIIKTIGIGESNLADKIADWETNLPKNIKLAYLPSIGQVKLRLTAIGEDEGALKEAVANEVATVLPLIQSHVYGFDHEEIEAVIGQMLLEKKQTIAFAESCTGGYLSHLVTSVPGSSKYYKGTVVSYDYDVKVNLLGVDPRMMEQKGAVSEEVVRQMAEGVRKKLGSDVGISVSGIAGPDGGTKEKPVGTVWIGYSDAQKTVARKFSFSKTRILNIEASAISALNMFRLHFPAN